MYANVESKRKNRMKIYLQNENCNLKRGTKIYIVNIIQIVKFLFHTVKDSYKDIQGEKNLYKT